MTEDQLKEYLVSNPNDFGGLCELAVVFRQKGNYRGCFAMVERAIASYEEHPQDEFQPYFLELKRLRLHLLHDSLPDILGSLDGVRDPAWNPVFKLGRPVEMGWIAEDSSLNALNDALQSRQLKRLRYLHLHVKSGADAVLQSMIHRMPPSLRSLDMQFDTLPSGSLMQAFYRENIPELAAIDSVSIEAPALHDQDAAALWHAFGPLTNFALISRKERCLTHKICETIADDSKSAALTRLTIAGSAIGDHGLFALMTSQNLSALQVLDVHDGILTNASAKAMKADVELSQIRTLDMRYNTIDPAGLAMLAGMRFEILTEGQYTRP